MTIFHIILHIKQAQTPLIFCHSHHLLSDFVNILRLCFESLGRLLAILNYPEASPTWCVFIISITIPPSYSNHPGLHPRHQLPRRRPRNPRPNLPLRHLAHLHNPHRTRSCPTASKSRNKPVSANLRLESASRKALARPPQPAVAPTSTTPHPPVRQTRRTTTTAVEQSGE